MGSNINRYINKTGTNPFADALSRNEAGELTVDIGRVMDKIGISKHSGRKAFGLSINDHKVYGLSKNDRNIFGLSKNDRDVSDMIKNMDRGRILASDLDNYNNIYHNSMVRDRRVSTMPLGMFGLEPIYAKSVYSSAVDEFKIKEQGEKAATAIRQYGRYKVRQANFGAELAAVNRAALSASEDNAYEQAGGNPDVVLSTDTDIRGAPAGQDGNARRRRAAFSGGGLRI